jgi:predicted permease
MFLTYLRIAARNLANNKPYALINIGGLAIGIACSLLIFLIIRFETSFDNFHADRDRIYRVITAEPGPGGIEYGSGVPFPTAAALRNDFPSMTAISSIFCTGGSILIESSGQVRKFKEQQIYYTDPTFFHIFHFPLIAGSPTEALVAPNTVLLTKDEAGKFFGDWRTAMGKVIHLNNRTNLIVTGILANIPDNSDFPLRVVVSRATLDQKGVDYSGNMSDWVSYIGSNYCFIKLPAGVSPASVNQALIGFVKKYRPVEEQGQRFQLQPLSDMHYNTGINIFSYHPFSRTLIAAIAAIGLFLIVIACVNFINLATARAVQRSKEVGVRKVLGSTRAQLISQILTETWIITLIAGILATSIASLAIPRLNAMLEIQLSTTTLSQPDTLLFLLVTSVVVTLLSGLYPAAIMSGYSPVAAFRNKMNVRRSSGLSLRSVLVVLQFCIAQVLVIGTLVILFQMNFFAKQSLGFDHNAVLTVPFPNDSINLTKLDALRDQLISLPGVKAVSYSFASASDENSWTSDFKFDHSSTKTAFDASLQWADANFFDLYKIHFIAGHPYPASPNTRGFVVNETLIRTLGIRDPQQAIGKQLNFWDDAARTGPIVGVIKDYAVSSLKTAITPVVLGSWQGVYQLINIKLQGANPDQTLASIRDLWNDAFPAGVYEYRFLDDRIAGYYKAERQLSNLIRVFTGLAIFISCLGLYGLVSFMAVQRTKEMGIRKTLGASAAQIVYLFSKEFTVLILVAFAISVPVGWYFMHRWLDNFSNRITIGPGIFILAIAVSILIAWLAVGYRAIAAALANPVKALRTE